MPSSPYKSLVETAKRMILEKGQSSNVIWKTRTNDTPSDPSMPWNGVAEIETEHSVSIIFLPNERYGRELYRYLADTTDVPVGNLLGFMAQVDFTPSLKDVVVRDGVELPILSFNAYDPDGSGVILYVIEFDGIKSV